MEIIIAGALIGYFIYAIVKDLTRTEKEKFEDAALDGLLSTFKEKD